MSSAGVENRKWRLERVPLIRKHRRKAGLELEEIHGVSQSVYVREACASCCVLIGLLDDTVSSSGHMASDVTIISER